MSSGLLPQTQSACTPGRPALHRLLRFLKLCTEGLEDPVLTPVSLNWGLCYNTYYRIFLCERETGI